MTVNPFKDLLADGVSWRPRVPSSTASNPTTGTTPSAHVHDSASDPSLGICRSRVDFSEAMLGA